MRSNAIVERNFFRFRVAVACQLFSMMLFLVVFGMNQSVDAQVETDQKKDWIKLTPTGARGSVLMPIKPRYVERSFAPIQGKPPVKVHLHLATTKGGLTTYIFGYHDLHAVPKDAKMQNAALDGAVRGAVGNVMGNFINDPKSKSYAKGCPGRLFEYSFSSGGKSFKVMAFVFLVDKRQYQLNAVMEAGIFDEVVAKKFLNSFELIIPEDDSPPRPRTVK